MPPKKITTGLMVLMLSATLPLAHGAPAQIITSPPPARRAVLIDMVREDCGSCHGSRLTGGLGPALTPQALKGKNPISLKDTILFGRPNTPMPPWNPFMSNAEAAWIVNRLMKGFPHAQ